MAHLFRVGIAETSTTTGTANFVLAGRVFGSLAGFFDVLSVNDTCDYVARYGDTREEGIATRLGSGELERTSISYARHANGTIDQNKVSFASGAKHIWMSVRGDRVTAFLDALRPQVFTQGQRNQACANIGMPQTGDKIVIPQVTAWVGWTKDTTHHNKAIRLVTDANGGSSGGSVDFDVLHARTATDNFTLGTTHIPAHDHGSAGGHSHSYFGNASAIQAGAAGVNATAPPSSISTSSDGAHTHSSVGGGSPHQHAIDMRVKYLNCISAIKD